MRKSIYILLLYLAVPILFSCGDDGSIESEESTPVEESIIQEPLQLIMLGPPGAGKGTQARMIGEKYSIPHISTGAILRAEVERKTLLGQEIEEVMKRGDLVADSLIFFLVEARLSEADCDNGFILDGFPRTIPQAEELDIMLQKRGKKALHVIYLMVTEEISLERLLARRRVDDTKEIFQQRIKVYHEQTAPLIDYYFEKGAIIRINGVQSIDDVFHEIEERLVRLGWE
jgi:adenylate kinase